MLFRSVVELFFEENRFVGVKPNDKFYFIYDETSPNNLKVAMNLDFSEIQGWYANPEDNPNFKIGYVSEWARSVVLEIVHEPTFEAAAAKIEEAAKTDKISATWGSIEDGEYTEIGPISESSKPIHIALLLKGAEEQS